MDVSRVNVEKGTPRYIMLKLETFKDRKKIIKATERKERETQLNKNETNVSTASVEA